MSTVKESAGRKKKTAAVKEKRGDGECSPLPPRLVRLSI
jgi:hypothetical protein